MGDKDQMELWDKEGKEVIDSYDVLSNRKGLPDFDPRTDGANPIKASILSEYLQRKYSESELDEVILDGVEVYKAIADGKDIDPNSDKGKSIIRTMGLLPWIIPENNTEGPLINKFKIDVEKYQLYRKWVESNKLKGGIVENFGNREKTIPPEFIGPYVLLKKALENSWTEEKPPYNKIGTDWFIKGQIHEIFGVSLKNSKILIETSKEAGLLVWAKKAYYQNQLVDLWAIDENLKLPDGISEEEYLKKFIDSIKSKEVLNKPTANQIEHIQDKITGLS